MFTVQCTVYTVHNTRYSIYNMVYIIHGSSITHSVKNKYMYTERNTINIVQCTVYIVHCTLYIVHYTVYIYRSSRRVRAREFLSRFAISAPYLRSAIKNTTSLLPEYYDSTLRVILVLRVTLDYSDITLYSWVVVGIHGCCGY